MVVSERDLNVKKPYEPVADVVGKNARHVLVWHLGVTAVHRLVWFPVQVQKMQICSVFVNISKNSWTKKRTHCLVVPRIRK